MLDEITLAVIILVLVAVIVVAVANDISKANHKMDDRSEKDESDN